MVKIHYDYLRSKKAGRLKQLFECEFTENEHLTTWRGTNATILPLRRVTGDQIAFGRGGVVDGNGDYVELSAINDRINYKYEFTDAPYDDSKVVYCGYLIDQWGHFLVETVARLWYFLENDETVDKYIFFIEEGSSRKIKGNYKEFFQLLKLWDKIDIINRPVTYREVIVPELGYDRRSGYSQKYKKIFDTIASNVDIDPTWRTPDKIYFSRSQLAKASGMEFGLEALDDFFATNGYEVIFPEKMPLS